jgi:hypothetical protein
MQEQVYPVRIVTGVFLYLSPKDFGVTHVIELHGKALMRYLGNHHVNFSSGKTE